MYGLIKQDAQVQTQKSTMLKKKSTTWSLRQQLAGAGLQQASDSVDQIDGVIAKRLKRKASTQLEEDTINTQGTN